MIFLKKIILKESFWNFLLENLYKMTCKTLFFTFGKLNQAQLVQPIRTTIPKKPSLDPHGQPSPHLYISFSIGVQTVKLYLVNEMAMPSWWDAISKSSQQNVFDQ